MKHMDLKIPSPSNRAEYLWAVIKSAAPDATDWDIICFCTEILGNFVPAFPFLEAEAKRLNKVVYTAHYLYPVDGQLDSGIIIGKSSVEPIVGETRRNNSAEPTSDRAGIISKSDGT